MLFVFALTIVGLQVSFGAPAIIRSDLDRARIIAEILHHESQRLRNTSMENNIIFKNMPTYPEKTPASSVTGKSFPQNLKDIFIKGHLFDSHMEEMSRHLQNLTRHLDPVSTMITIVRGTLQRLLQTAKKISESLHPEMGQLAVPAPPEFPERDFFEQKSHGTVVVFRLGTWVKNVQRVLREHHERTGHNEATR